MNEEQQPQPKQKIRRTTIATAIIFAACAILAIVVYLLQSPPPAPHEYDSFAQCIGQSSTTFYGAFWCPHCYDQKALFGTGAQYLPYVECSTPDGKSEKPECTAQGVAHYPTWVFRDGSRLEGVAPLSQLSQKTGCALPLSTENRTISGMTPFVQSFTDYLSLGTLIADIAAIFLLLLLVVPFKSGSWQKKLGRAIGEREIFLSFLIAAAGVAGSLFYSQFAHFAPCELCWIQRGLLYTQAVIFLVAILARNTEKILKYRAFVRSCALSLSGIGVVVAAYNMYLQFGGNALAPCSATGPSCQFVYFMEYGYITIPTMSLTAFVLIILFMLFRKAGE